MPARFETEHVSENYEKNGVMGTRTFWVAYPPDVAGYGHQEERISRAWGRADTRKEALAIAEARARKDV